MLTAQEASCRECIENENTYARDELLREFVNGVIPLTPGKKFYLRLLCSSDSTWLSFDYWPNQTVGFFRRMVSARTGYPKKDFRLRFAGGTLFSYDDERTLSQCRIIPDSAIHLVWGH